MYKRIIQNFAEDRVL